MTTESSNLFSRLVVSTKQTLVVIGNGMVGQNFLASLVASANYADFKVVTFCEEPRPTYDRVHLSSFFSGKTADDLSLVEADFFERHDITVHIGDQAVAINRQAKSVTSAKGLVVAYDKLVLATGTSGGSRTYFGSEVEELPVWMLNV